MISYQTKVEVLAEQYESASSGSRGIIRLISDLLQQQADIPPVDRALLATLQEQAELQLSGHTIATQLLSLLSICRGLNLDTSLEMETEPVRPTKVLIMQGPAPLFGQVLRAALERDCPICNDSRDFGPNGRCQHGFRKPSNVC